ncbi:hypothetical protein OG879_20630 [Streptomyces caniferus]|nr:hypothetical protein [Streptomyces caniferus]
MNPQVLQRTLLELPNTLARDSELLADLVQRPGCAVDESVSQQQNVPNALRELAPVEELKQFLALEVGPQCLLRARHRTKPIDDQIPESRALTDGLFERQNRPTAQPQACHHPFGVELTYQGKIVHIGVCTLPEKLPFGLPHLLHIGPHVDREPNGRPFVGHGPSDALPNPPRGIGGKLAPHGNIELLHGTDESDHAVLREIFVHGRFRPVPQATQDLVDEALVVYDHRG